MLTSKKLGCSDEFKKSLSVFLEPCVVTTSNSHVDNEISLNQPRSPSSIQPPPLIFFMNSLCSSEEVSNPRFALILKMILFRKSFKLSKLLIK
ncbi:MAG: hypothetical protein QGH65_17775, partial [SAR324 cluster bacterium]|nr:hypothetical protein [SAR324 cluster bacterium]